jgi:vacuolar-type H+-ATPase subunit C/Vma6
MNRTSRYAFVQAKLYGILARSFVGQNYRDILRLKNVSELYDTLFPGQRAEQPEHAVTEALEGRIAKAAVEAMIYVLDLLGDSPEILVHMLRKREYHDLKAALRGLARGNAERAAALDLGPYAGVALAGAKDTAEAIRKSPYAWVIPLLETTPLFEIENRLDRDYYVRLLELAKGLPSRDRTGVLRLVNVQIALANVIWALRLRFFFGLDGEKARPLLIPGMVDAQRKALELVFEIPSDAAEEWRKWKYGWLLEDQLGESFKAPDPVRAEQKADQRLYTRAHQLFHQGPFTLCPLAAYFTLKEYEAALLKTAAEAIALSIPENDVLAIVGAP